MKYFLSVFLLIMCCIVVHGQTISPSGSATYCVGSNVALTVNGAAAGSTFQWRRDGVNVAIGNPYNASTNGSYTVIVTSPTKKDTLGPVVVTSTPNPVPNFTFPANACSGTNVAFASTVTSGTAPFTYAWDFGDGGVATGANPSHAFTSLGCSTATFTVRLVVTDSKGCSTTISKTVTILQAPALQLADPNDAFTPFSNCINSPTAADPNFTITVNNVSPSAACITGYNINWGDGNTQNNVAFPLTHTYTQLGSFNLVVTAAGTNGCNASRTYIVANQSNPAGSLGTLGSTTNLCAPALVPFTISNWQINSPGTMYVLDFGDGSSVTLNQPLNATNTDHIVNHTYTTSSCPASSYTATLRVINACDNTPYTAGNIQIRVKPTADFTIIPNPACTGQSVCFNNTSILGSYGPSCSTMATYLWDFGDNSPTSSLESPCHTYTAPGTYTVTLTSANPCGTTTISKEVCITNPPAPAFTITGNAGCAPLAVSATNTTNTFNSCQNPRYRWDVVYTPAFCGTSQAFTYTNGTSDTSASPSFNFTNPGTYTITQNVTNACGTFRTSQTISVKKPPEVSINPPTYPCGPVTITPQATVTSCGTAVPTYAWTFAGGTPATSTTANPGQVTFTTVGNHAITLAVTNECGTTTATENVIVSVAPDVIVPDSQFVCGGLTTGPFNFSSTVGTPVYNWTNNNPSIGLPASGTGNITAFLAINAGANPVTATITVTPFVSTSCSGIPSSFTITVNPRPAIPVATTDYNYCLNATAPALTATATGTNTITWYNNANLTGGSATAPVPATNVANTFLFYVTQTNSFGCVSAPAIITVVVNPALAGNTIATSQNICANTVPAPLTAGNVSGGSGAFTFQWQRSSDGGNTWANIPGASAETYAPPALTATLQYRRVVTSLPCSDTSNIVIITVQGALSNFNISAAQTICALQTPALLAGELPTGGGGSYRYTWESSTDNNTWTSTGITTQNYQPAALSQTTYFRRRVDASQCSAVSNTIAVTVNLTPVASIAALPAICTTDIGTIRFTTISGAGPFNLNISVRRPVGADSVISRTVNNNANIDVISAGSVPGRYIITLTRLSDTNGCADSTGNISNVTIDVIVPITNTIQKDSIICAGESVTIQTLALSGGGTIDLAPQYSYEWEMTPANQTNWQLMPGETLATLTVTPTASTCYRRKVKSNGLCESISSPVCITVNAGIGNNSITASQEPCINTTPQGLTGGNPTGGDNNYIYQWQTSTDSIIWSAVGAAGNYAPPVYTQAGIHYFRRIVRSGGCNSTSNVVTITVRPDTRALFTGNPTTICDGADLGSVITVTPFPDNNGTYEWYADGVLFGSNTTGDFPGYIIQNPGDTIVIKLKTLSAFGCKSDSIQQQFITVLTAIARFTKDVSDGCGPLTVNFTNASSILNSNISYTWNFGNGETSIVLQPGPIVFPSSPFFTDTTYQVRLAVYNGCDTTIWRDSVLVKADPNARFGVDTTFGCSPFTVQIDNTSPGNNTYYWDFGDGTRDTTFNNSIFSHTYNIGNIVDTFTIRLIAENQCKRDTQMLNVRVAPNIIRPLINVNSSQLFGCAPHIVSFNNNSSGATGYTWNFGDNSAPIVTNNNETTVFHTYTTAGVFTVSIDITNGCSDTTVYREITVYDKPIAAFTTNTAIYCAGDTVRVTNNSQNATNYRWFWGDGTTGAGETPTHVYTAAGNFNIVLQAQRTNSAGLVCLDTLLVPVTVLAKPMVTVQSNIRVINCAPFTLTVAAPGIISETVTWYFNDSTATPSVTTATGVSAQYVFTKPGTFSVKMIAVNAQGCTDSTIISFTVRGKAAASFTPGDLQVCTRDTTINYTNTSTYNGSDPLNYRWLVDNVVASTNGNLSYRYNVSATAVLPRSFNTWLIVSNAVGCSDTAKAVLQMNPTATAQFSIVNTNDCVPYSPTIRNNSLNATSYQWSVNGVPVSTAAIPAIPITQGSTSYTVTLVADNSYGCTPDSFSVTFTSRARPAAAFRLSDTLGCTGVLNVATTNLTTGARTYTWNWGDGTPNSALTSPTHLYNIPGQYLVTLVASDGVCTDTTEQLVKVSVKPVVDFAVDQVLTCDTAKVQFTNLTVNGNNYVWSFSDGTSSNETNPFKAFPPRNAAYTVKLVAESSLGCKDSAVKANLVTAKIPPAVDFQISPNPVITVPNYTFNFNNLTLNSANYSYLWALGDGAFATTRDVSHKYIDTGNYLVQLTVLDDVSNCAATRVKVARIDGFPGYLYVPNAICPACISSATREFIPKGIGLKEYRLQIFTTWGELIFETRELDNKGAPVKSWDGKFKGVVVQQDVYIWRIDAKYLNGSEWLGMLYPGDSKYKKAGTITVVN